MANYLTAMRRASALLSHTYTTVQTGAVLSREDAQAAIRSIEAAKKLCDEAVADLAKVA